MGTLRLVGTQFHRYKMRLAMTTRLAAPPVALLLAFFCVSPKALIAQACIGSHTYPGEGMLRAGVSFTDGATGYGGNIGGYTAGSVFLSGGYEYQDLEDSDLSLNAVTASLGVELPNPNVSICPLLGAGYGWAGNLPTGSEQSTISLRGGVGLGKSFGENVLVTPFGTAQLVQAWTSFSGSAFGTEVDISESDTGGVFRAGVVIGSRRVFAGPSVSITTFEGSDPVVSGVVGVIF